MILGEGFVALNTIRAYAYNLGSHLSKLGVVVSEATRFFRAADRFIFRVEVEDDILLVSKVPEREVVFLVGWEGEVGGFFSNFQSR